MSREDRRLAALALSLGLCAAALLLEAGARLFASSSAREADESLRSAEAYRWFPQLRLALPLPGERITLHKPEFVDRFPTTDLLGIGAGFFDDGLDERPLRALATGDSFTRGVGSGDQLARGWVELTEKRLPWLDLVNLGNSATGPLHQMRFYSKIADRIPHRWVLINFYSGNDFIDDADPFDLHSALETLPEGERSTALASIQRALTLAAHPDYALHARCRSRSHAWRLVCRAFVTPSGEPAGLALYERLKSAATDPLVTAEAIAAAKRSNESADLLEPSELRLVGDRMFRYGHQRDAALARVLASHSAAVLSRYAAEVRRRGKTPFVVIHPSAVEALLPAGDEGLERPVALLKAGLPKDLRVLDLTPSLRAAARSSDERLYWRADDHYTPAGYRAAAQAIAAFLDAQPHPNSAKAAL